VSSDDRDRWSAFLSTPIDAVAANVMSESWIGRRFGSYEITALVGAGGMGEVYRARDTRLGRDVAIKVLPASFVADRDRLARFEREARMLAALNHPHIATIYGIEEIPNPGPNPESRTPNPVLVLELVDGETLADRVARGPMPWRDALPIAKQICDGLEAAHEKGIIHRDLKPSNIALTKSGAVKLLDFGLAKEVETSGQTVTRSGDAGLLGTAAYMSPEQARGQAVDKRTDIWAFGCVLYEMLTGRRAFAGATVSDHIAAILEREPDWSALPATTPAATTRVLRRCLDKDRARRLHDIADARIDLEDVSEPAAPATRASPLAATLVAGAIVALAAALLLLRSRQSTPAGTSLRVSMELGADTSMPTEVGPNVALSPDGAMLAFVALANDGHTTQLYIRRLDALNAVAMAGTDDARNPFFSPDSRWVAFFDQFHGKLKKVAVSGGAPTTIADAPDGRGGAWLDDRWIVFQPRTGRLDFSRVIADGGSPEPFLTARLGTAGSIRWPQLLRGGKAILYTSGSAGQFEAGTIVAQTIPNGEPQVVLRDAYFGRYLETGHILFMRHGTLFAERFDADRLEATGPAVQIAEGVAGSAGTGSAEFAVSRNGTLMYVPSTSNDDVLSLMDRSGQATVLRAAPGIWTNPMFSPDGDRLALDISDGAQFNLWVYDLLRDTATKLTFDGTNFSRPVWSPDGKLLAFGLRRGGSQNLHWARADGSGEPQRLLDNPKNQDADSWHPSGKFLAYTEYTSQTNADLMIVPIDRDETSGVKAGKPFAFLATPFYESNPMFSPDGRWIAYETDETGDTEIVVRSFPGPGPKVQISSGGGHSPRWSASKHELLFRGEDHRIMAASYRVEGDAFRAEKPQIWSPRALPPNVMRPLQRTVFAVHPDGERVALYVPPAPVRGERDKVVLVFNFVDELKRLVPIASR